MEREDLAGYVTLREAADRLGTTPNAIYVWIRRHGIPTKRAGRMHLVRLVELVQMKVPAGKLVWASR